MFNIQYKRTKMKTMSIIGKYLDQPMVVAKFTKAVPYALIGGGLTYTLNHINKTPKKEKKNEFVKTASVLIATIGSALVAPRLAAKITKTVERDVPLGLSELKAHQTDLIEKFLSKNNVKKEIKEILGTAKTDILKFSKLKKVYNELWAQKEGKAFLDKLIPGPENIDSKHIFGEIGRLSVMGLIPVLGGVFGGIVGDKLTDKKWKEKIPNKIKEGSYQYLANIFLCNVGAGGALWAMEKAKITSKAGRALGMITGIVATGIIGGSAIANFIGNKVINPLCEKKGERNFGKNKFYNERKPELLDVGLHVDDIATVAVMSGLKWIEPALPGLYAISGFRAGIGYRNGEDGQRNHRNAFKHNHVKRGAFSAIN